MHFYELLQPSMGFYSNGNIGIPIPILGLFPIPPIPIFAIDSHSRGIPLVTYTIKHWQEVSTNVTGVQSNLAKGHITSPHSDERIHLLHALVTTEPLQTCTRTHPQVCYIQHWHWLVLLIMYVIALMTENSVCGYILISKKHLTWQTMTLYCINCIIMEFEVLYMIGLGTI